MNWKSKAGELQWHIKPFIGGSYRAAKAERTFENINPATDKVLCNVSEGCAADIDDAVAVARKCFNDGTWSAIAASQRKAILLRFADLVVTHQHELALLDCLEVGKPISAALVDANSFAPHFIREAAELADKIQGSVATMSDSNIAFNMYEARGVIGAIVPWNFPMVNAAIKIAPALSVGNSVVLKPSELSSGSALKLAELAVEAGVPPGTLNVVPGLGHTVGAALASHSDVDLLTFTGSTRTGRHLMTLAGQSNGKPLLLECGGKSPHLVFDDVDDLDYIADIATQKMFWNQGQVCSALVRLIVHSSIKDRLLEKIIERTSMLEPNDPLDERTTFGALASAAQRDRVKGYIELGINEGATAVLGGLGAIKSGAGCFVSPTIFDNVASEMRIAQEEIFGPVLCVQMFEDEKEALEIANATAYGLSACVWTKDMGRGKRMAKGIHAGGVTIRTSGDEISDGSSLSFAPQKASGFGAESGIEGLKSYCSLKAVRFYGD